MATALVDLYGGEPLPFDLRILAAGYRPSDGENFMCTSIAPIPHKLKTGNDIIREAPSRRCSPDYSLREPDLATALDRDGLVDELDPRPPTPASPDRFASRRLYEGDILFDSPGADFVASSKPADANMTLEAHERHGGFSRFRATTDWPSACAQPYVSLASFSLSFSFFRR